jgi:predicted AlkP superfamily pyrophosphatase or phosphodiesterase
MKNDEFFWKFSAATGWSLTDIRRRVEDESDEEWEKRTGFKINISEAHKIPAKGPFTVEVYFSEQWIAVSVTDECRSDFDFIAETNMDLMAWIAKYQAASYAEMVDCDDCVFWKRGSSSALGKCRRHPPTAVGGEFGMPTTRSTDGCGDGTRGHS